MCWFFFFFKHKRFLFLFCPDLSLCLTICQIKRECIMCQVLSYLYWMCRLLCSLWLPGVVLCKALYLMTRFHPLDNKCCLFTRGLCWHSLCFCFVYWNGHLELLHRVEWYFNRLTIAAKLCDHHLPAPTTGRNDKVLCPNMKIEYVCVVVVCLCWPSKSTHNLRFALFLTCQARARSCDWLDVCLYLKMSVYCELVYKCCILCIM